ncbi:MAG: flagellar motor switch protein FliN [Bryobacteraceae bacterium]|nr:flagellar motor switch protein FliN [Bryobacteraceae bacterium]
MKREAIWLAEQWATRLGPAVSAMTGERSSARVAPEMAVGEQQAAISGQLSFDAVPGARVSVLVSERVWKAVAKAVLAAAGIEEADAAELESTFQEVLQQSLSPLAQAIGKLLGREVNAGQWQKTATDETDANWVGVVLDLRGEGIGGLWIAPSKELLQAVQPMLPGEAGNRQPALPPEGARTGTGRESKTLDLLLEVELPVGVSFGRTQMRLKDAVKLSTGSIVELNRKISEPVEIIVNNCVIARGEVVVVEGNYGVRIKEIISREERLRTLF